MGLEKLDGHRDVEAHAYSNGRYKVRIEPHDGKDHSHDEPTQESIKIKTHVDDEKIEGDDEEEELINLDHIYENENEDETEEDETIWEIASS